MLKPETIKKLQAEFPELQELRLHLAQEAAKLNTLDGLGGLSITERAYEVTARLRAFETIKAILAPIVNVEDVLTPPDPKEYVV